MGTDSKYIEYKYRYFNLFLFFMTNLMCNIGQYSISTVADAVGNAYSLSPLAVNSTILVVMGVTVIATFPIIFVISRKGLRAGVISNI
jgi:hypothetical protein